MASTHDVLAALVARVRCKPGWSFALRQDRETGGTCLVITVEGRDSSQPGQHVPLAVSHWHPVPLATYNERTWRRWIFDKCRGVENHELGEWFRDGAERPFAPTHGPGEDPYVVHEFRPPEDALTTQDGSLRAPYPADEEQR